MLAHAQSWAGAGTGNAEGGGLRRPAVGHRFADRPAVARPRRLSHSRTNDRSLLLPRAVVQFSSHASGQLSGRGLPPSTVFHSVGFVGALDELADIVVFDRAGAFTGTRPQFLKPADHLARQSSDRPKTHQSVLSSAVVAVEANHDPKGFRVVRTAFREAGNEFRG